MIARPAPGRPVGRRGPAPTAWHSSVVANWWGRRRAARAVVLDPRDRILLISARDPARPGGAGWWELPGGGIDPGEATVDAVRRELWEEAGIRDAEIGPCVWTQAVEFTFGGWHFDQDEWIHVVRCDGTAAAPAGLESLEALAFGEQRWWTVEDAVAAGLRTIPYRLLEFLPTLVEAGPPPEPLDITPDPDHVARWRSGG
jgi:8-oxo-dGTP pyrophosphatase MutT (NUDIX family)